MTDAHEQHVWTVLSGFGLRAIPFAPFRAALGPNPRSLDLESDASGEERFARVIADGEGGYASKLAEETPSLFDVVEIEAGPQSDHWRLETHAFSARLPGSATLHSTPADDPSPFVLTGPGGIALYVQSAAKAPPLEAMAACGQTISARGEDWIALEYEHDGAAWVQRHSLRAEGLVTTVQSPQAFADSARVLWEGFLESHRSI